MEIVRVDSSEDESLTSSEDENLTVSEITQGKSSSGVWTFKNWSKCHKFLAAHTSCTLQVGLVSLRFFLRPLEKTFQNEKDCQVGTLKFYSLWVEVVDNGGERELFFNVQTEIEADSQYYKSEHPEEYVFNSTIPTDSQVVVNNLLSESVHNRAVLVEEQFLCMGSDSIYLGGNCRFDREYIYSREKEVTIDITATLFHFADTNRVTGTSNKNRSLNGAELLSNQLGTLLLEKDEDKNLHDIQLKMKDDVILHAHRAILSARSPVFQAMFSSSMKEATCDVVTIPDIGSDAMRVILKYMYTGSVDDSWGKCFAEVVHGASKYDLPKLLDYCDTNVMTICTVHNAVELFRLAKLHSLKNAMRLLTDFTKENTASVLLSMGTE